VTIVAFTGSRDFTNEVAVLVALRGVAKHGATVHVGDARGLDRMVSEACERIGIPCVVHVADWAREGKAAGFRRNARMLASRPDRLVAFYGPSGETKGTKHTVDLALAAGIPVMVFRETTMSWETLP
jgi:hypothetical protein